MHVVIPTRVSKQNYSLTFALASIRNHTDYIPVLIGHNPGLHELHIPTAQGRDIFANTDTAMRVACETGWISDPFIWSADDIYWIRPAEPVRWAIGDLQDDTRATIYGKRKAQTARTLGNLGLPTLDYESHTPLPVTKTAMLHALTLPGSPRSLYGNLTGRPDMIAPDVKLRNRRAPMPNTPWVSTGGDPVRFAPLMFHLTHPATTGAVGR